MAKPNDLADLLSGSQVELPDTPAPAGQQLLLSPDGVNKMVWVAPGDLFGNPIVDILILGSDTWAAIDAILTPSLHDAWVLTDNDPTAPNFGARQALQGDLVMWFGSEWLNLGPIQGPQGIPGEDGADGAQGIQGIQGDQGIQGIPGTKGMKGDKGDKGDTGAQGPQGIQGIPGTKGMPGEVGQQGPQGIQGEKGEKGDKGETGSCGCADCSGNGGGVNLTAGLTPPPDPNIHDLWYDMNTLNLYVWVDDAQGDGPAWVPATTMISMQKMLWSQEIDSDLVPLGDDFYNLGRVDRRFQNGYISRTLQVGGVDFSAQFGNVTIGTYTFETSQVYGAPEDGYVLTYDHASGRIVLAPGGTPGAAGHTIQDEGTPLTARTNLNFVGAGVTATDDVGNDATVVTIPGGGAGGNIYTQDGVLTGDRVVNVQASAYDTQDLLIRHFSAASKYTEFYIWRDEIHLAEKDDDVGDIESEIRLLSGDFRIFAGSGGGADSNIETNEGRIYMLTQAAGNGFGYDIVIDTSGTNPNGGDIFIDPAPGGHAFLGNFEFDTDQNPGAGQDNYVLTYNDSTGLISLEAAAGGGGGVSGSGADNQVAVWSGASSIEGTANMTFDSSVGWLTLTDSGGVHTTAGPALYFNNNDNAPMDTGDRLGAIWFQGSWDASNSNTPGAFIIADATEPWGSGAYGTRLEFYVVENSNGTQTKKFEMLPTGAFEVEDGIFQTGTFDGDVSLLPSGTGNVILGTLTIDGDQVLGPAEDGLSLTYDHSTGLISVGANQGGFVDVLGTPEEHWVATFKDANTIEADSGLQYNQGQLRVHKLNEHGLGTGGRVYIMNDNGVPVDAPDQLGTLYFGGAYNSMGWTDEGFWISAYATESWASGLQTPTRVEAWIGRGDPYDDYVKVFDITDQGEFIFGSSIDVVSPSIKSNVDEDIFILPGGTGNVHLGTAFEFDADQSVGAGQDNMVLTYDNATGLISLEAAPLPPGTLTASGTPLDGQVAVWVDQDTLEGDSSFVFDTSNDQLTIGNMTLDGLATVGAGQDNYVLTYDDGTGLISLEASAAGGNVSNTGTPLATQFAVWTNATTLEGLTDFTRINAAGGGAFQALSTNASGAASGAIYFAAQDDGTVMESGERLGSLAFRGAEDASNTLHTSAVIQGVATETWSNLANGARIELLATANGAALTTEVGSFAPAQITLTATNIDLAGTQVGLGNFQFDADQVVGPGVDNYVLTYDDASGLISLEPGGGGGGDVQVSGTPADNQLAVWVNATSIEGTSNLTYDGLAFVAGNYNFNVDQTVGAGQDDMVLTYNNSTGQIGLEALPAEGANIYTGDGALTGNRTVSVQAAPYDNQRLEIEHYSATNRYDRLYISDNFSALQQRDDDVGAGQSYFQLIGGYFDIYSGASGGADNDIGTNEGRIYMLAQAAGNGVGYDIVIDTAGSNPNGGDIFLDPAAGGHVFLGNFEFDTDQNPGAGQDDYVLTYNDSTGLISLEPGGGGGGGNVNSSGTPVNDQLAIWTNATTIEGQSTLRYTSTQFVAGNYVFDRDQTVGAAQDNMVLTYDDASGEIRLEAQAGGGNVSNTGTPVDNQIAVWINATTVEGLDSLTFDDGIGVMRVTRTALSGSGAGGVLQLGTDDGAALASGDRLGVYNLFGTTDGVGTVAYGGGMRAFASEAWGASAAGTYVEFFSTPNGQVGNVTGMTLEQDGSLTMDAGGNIDLNDGNLLNVGTLTIDGAGNQGVIQIHDNTNGTAGQDHFWLNAGASYFDITGTNDSWGAGNVIARFHHPSASSNAGNFQMLGGDIDLDAGDLITTVTNGGISILPNGTGNVTLGTMVFDSDQAIGAGQDNYVLTYDDGTGLISLEPAAGGGNVSNTGTPEDNQLAIWTSATTVEGKANLRASAAGTQLYILNNFTPSATSGGRVFVRQDDGTAVAAGDRLGTFTFQGAEDASNTLHTGGEIAVFANENWDASNNGARMEFYINADGVAGGALALTLENDGSLTMDAGGDITGFNRLIGSSASSTVADFTFSGASGLSGANIALRQDDGAAMGSGEKLGGMLFYGAEDAANTTHLGVELSAYTTEAWTASANGSRLVILTTPNGSNSRQTIAAFEEDGALEMNILPTIRSTGNLDITLDPGGTGNVILGNFEFDADQAIGAGQDNYVLTYNDGTGLISLEAATGGGGNVTKVGTPVNNEIGIWTGDGTIEGDTNFQWTGTALNATGSINLLKNDQTLFTAYYTGASASNGGASVIIGQDDGAAMGANERLGIFAFAGAADGASTMQIGASVEGHTTEAWSGSAEGAEVQVLTTANGATARTLAATFGQDNSLAVVGDITGANLTGTNTGDQTSIVGITGTKAQFDAALTDGNFGTVDVSGTPVDNQVAIWTDPDTIEGTDRMTYDGAAAALRLTRTGGIGGSSLYLQQDDGTTMLNNERIGFISFTGAEDNLGNLNNSILIEGYATETWSDSQAGAELRFAIAAPGQFTRTHWWTMEGGGNLVAEQANNIVLNGGSILSTTGQDITLDPGGVGNVILGNFEFDADQTVGAGQDNYVLTYDNSTGLISLEAAPSGGANQLSDLSDVNTSTPTNRNVLVADGVDWESRALVEADISDLGTYLARTGTPVDNQIAVFTDADTVEGDANFTWSGTDLDVTGHVNLTNGLINVNRNDSITQGWFQYTGASGPATGASFLLSQNDGAAMAAGDRLGLIVMAGAEDGANTLNTSLSIEGFATENWNASQNGAEIRVFATANGTTGRSLVATFAPGLVDLGNFAFDTGQTVGAGQDNYVLTYDNGTGLISLEAASGGGATQLSELSDVNTSTPTNRNVLVADGVDWESRALVEADISDLGSYATQLSELSDVNTSAPTNRNVLVADGVDWESRALVEADISDLGAYITASSTDILTNKTVDAQGTGNAFSNFYLGFEVDWNAAADITDRSAAPASGDKLIIFEAGVGMRKIDWDDLPSGGSGDVTKVGTPADNQIGVWTGDGTIEGTDDFTWDDSAHIFALTDSAAGGGPSFRLINDDGGLVPINESLGFVQFLGEDGGGTHRLGAQIAAYAEQNFSASSVGSRLEFRTGNFSASTTDLAMTIDSQQDVIFENDIRSEGMYVQAWTTGSTANGPFLRFEMDDSGALLADTVMGQVRGWGSEDGGGTLREGARMLLRASDDWGPGSSPGKIDFLTTGVGSTTATLAFSIEQDNSAVLYGDLNVQDNQITTTTANGGIDIQPNGTGNVTLGNFVFDGDQTVGVGQDNYVLTYDNATGLISLEVAGGGSGDVTAGAGAATGYIAIWETATEIVGDEILFADRTNHILSFTDSTASGADAGVSLQWTVDDLAAMASGDQLGELAFRGAFNGLSATFEAASLEVKTTEAWGASRGAEFQFFTTPTGSALKQSTATIHKDEVLFEAPTRVFSNTDQLIAVNTGSNSATEGSGASLELRHNTNNPQAFHRLGRIDWTASAGGVIEPVARIEVSAVDNFDTDQSGGEMVFWATQQGTSVLSQVATFSDDEANFNVPIFVGATNGIDMDGKPIQNIHDLRMDTALVTNSTWAGPSTRDHNAGATLAFGDLVVMNSSGEWVLADADATATAVGNLGIAVEAATASNPVRVALKGAFIRLDSWAWTAGQVLYISTTAGDMTATAPSGAADIIRVVGRAGHNGDHLWFDPTSSWVEHD